MCVLLTLSSENKELFGIQLSVLHYISYDIRKMLVVVDELGVSLVKKKKKGVSLVTLHGVDVDWAELKTIFV